MPNVRLHQFPYSHFNEKARWALTFKKIQHERQSYLPGPHGPAIKRMTGQTQTPVLAWDDRIIAGSAAIIDFLETQVPEPALYPANEADRTRALELAAQFDETIGPANRTVLFSVMLNEAGYMTGMFSTGKSLPVRLFYRATFPLAKGLIAEANGVNPENIARSREITAAALEEIQQLLDGGDYLVGDQFSVADLTACALFAPLANPHHPDIARPLPVPDSIQAIIDDYASHPTIDWVADIYRRHRD